MSDSMQITIYCPKCGGSIEECQCKDAPLMVCGTCNQPYNLCKCSYEEQLRRCHFCMKFEASEPHAATGWWVCPSCLNNKAVQFELEKYNHE